MSSALVLASAHPPRPASAPGWVRLVRGLGVAVVGALVLAVAVVWSSPAHAHAELIESDPADGAELNEAPDEIVLTFNEHLEQIGAEVLITDADGNEVQDGDPRISGPTLSHDLTEDRPAGEYTAQWRVVSADGHPVSGEFTFTAAEATGPEAGSEPDAGDAAPDATEDGEARTGEGAGNRDTDAGDEAAGGDAAAQAPADEVPETEAQPLLPWGLIFALAGVGVVLALVVRARRQLRDREEAGPRAIDPEDSDPNS
ncbi:copper resistance CopC family protein [Pseudactinotalea sp. Z1748]|uniref:copper resistance CopC family protein n=1 Tax=Pseudactinotalea sp. Z1748 TaxID=3413027 RepID=UPI003C7D0410